MKNSVGVLKLTFKIFLLITFFSEAGIPELLEVDDMLSFASPEPKSVMTYVSSIYKHFNPS